MHPPHSRGNSVPSKSRRLDSHQHKPVYKTGAFLSRATSAEAAIAAAQARGFEPRMSVLEADCSPRSTLVEIGSKGDRAESNRCQTDSQSVSGNQHRTRPQRKERELNSQGTFMLDRLPTGSRHLSGSPSVVCHQQPDQDSNPEHLGRNEG